MRQNIPLFFLIFCFHLYLVSQEPKTAQQLLTTYKQSRTDNEKMRVHLALLKGKDSLREGVQKAKTAADGNTFYHEAAENADWLLIEILKKYYGQFDLTTVNKSGRFPVELFDSKIFFNRRYCDDLQDLVALQSKKSLTEEQYFLLVNRKKAIEKLEYQYRTMCYCRKQLALPTAARCMSLYAQTTSRSASNRYSSIVIQLSSSLRNLIFALCDDAGNTWYHLAAQNHDLPFIMALREGCPQLDKNEKNKKDEEPVDLIKRDLKRERDLLVEKSKLIKKLYTTPADLKEKMYIPSRIYDTINNLRLCKRALRN